MLMKTFSRCGILAGFWWLLAFAGLHAQAPSETPYPGLAKNFSAGYRIVFFSVLEGCFQDGLTDADVDQILRNPKPDEQWYEHFIQNCPVCMATIQALQTYKARPSARLKIPGKVTFGDGLSPEMHARLYGDVLKERLSALHDLEQVWVQRHIASLRLDPEELARTQQHLKEARDEGIKIMQMFHGSPAFASVAPGYREGDECAVCNAANGMALKVAPNP